MSDTTPIIVCGGDYTPEPRSTDCPSELHDWPLPAGYVDAGEVAGQRIRQGWRNAKCREPGCLLYGWVPPAFARIDESLRRPLP